MPLRLGGMPTVPTAGFPTIGGLMSPAIEQPRQRRQQTDPEMEELRKQSLRLSNLKEQRFLSDYEANLASGKLKEQWSKNIQNDTMAMSMFREGMEGETLDTWMNKNRGTELGTYSGFKSDQPLEIGGWKIGGPGMSELSRDQLDKIYNALEVANQTQQPLGRDAAMMLKDAGINIERIKEKKPLVEVRVGEKGMGELEKEMAKSLVEERDEVENFVQSLKNLQPTKRLLDKGMITGFGAKPLLTIGRMLNKAGVTDSETIANTEAYASSMGNQVAQIIKQFGAGTGLSDADREYAAKIAGGDISLTANSLRKIISMNETAMTNIIKTYNQKA
jgi:hypothetical protein